MRIRPGSNRQGTYSAYAPDRIRESLGNIAIDVMIAPINGAYGNLNAKEACGLAELLKPKILIASHFWMFVEHGGDPALFLEESKRLSGIKGMVMAPGEVMTIDAASSMKPYG
jgi:L-ascorbate 6-phosphate lactonase